MSVSTVGASTICQKVRTLPKGPLRAMLGVERVRLGLRIRLFDVIGCGPCTTEIVDNLETGEPA